MHSSAKWICLVLGALAWVSPASAQPPTTPPTTTTCNESEAKERFVRGVALYDEADYRLAVIEFERSYATCPSYRVLYNIAQARLQLARYASALEALERYLAEGGARIPATRQQEVNVEIESTRARTALLEISRGTNGAHVILDGEAIGAIPLPQRRVDAGEHHLKVTKTGYTPIDKVLVLAGGDAARLTIELVPLPPVVLTPNPRSPSNEPRTAMWVSWIATGVLAAGSASCGILALSSAADLKTARGQVGTTSAERQSLADRANNFSIVADGLAAAAVISGVVALYFTLRAPNSRGPSGVAPQIVPNVGGLTGVATF